MFIKRKSKNSRAVNNTARFFYLVQKSTQNALMYW